MVIISYNIIVIYIYICVCVCVCVCPDEEKGCSARDLVIVEPCGAVNLLSNDIKFVMI